MAHKADEEKLKSTAVTVVQTSKHQGKRTRKRTLVFVALACYCIPPESTSSPRAIPITCYNILQGERVSQAALSDVSTARG